MLQTWFEKLDRHLKDRGLFSRLEGADRLLVAFSGGADSTFLLRYAVSRFGKEKVRALHFNHRIRRSESDRDQAFCEEACRLLGVPISIESADVPAIAAERGNGAEEAGRFVRYGFFEKEAEKEPGQVFVLTAHNAGDQLETVLFHFLRGSGTKGLSGIPETRGIFIRPMLSLTGEEIRDALRDGNIPFVEDTTNGDETYSRNYLRHEIVPRLRQIVPSPEEAAARLAELCARDDDCLEMAAIAALEPYEGKRSVPAEAILAQHDAVATRMILLRHRAFCPDAPSLSKEQTEKILSFLRAKRPGKLTLPGKVLFTFSGGRMAFRDGTFRPGEEIPEASLPPEGEILFGPYRISSCPGEKKKDGKTAGSLQADVKFDRINEHLTVRTPRPGDVCRLNGMTKSVRKMLSQKNYSEEVRKTCPVFLDGEKIVWIPGFPPCDGYRGEGTVRSIMVQVTKENGYAAEIDFG